MTALMASAKLTRLVRRTYNLIYYWKVHHAKAKRVAPPLTFDEAIITLIGVTPVRLKPGSMREQGKQKRRPGIRSAI